MKNDDLKNIWQTGVHTDIKSYSDRELNVFVVKSARKSMRTIQLNGLFQLVVIAVTLYLITRLIFGEESADIKLLDFSALLILVVCSFFWKRSDRKMNQYDGNIPVKEWLEYRISELRKSIRLGKKYHFLLVGSAFFFGFGYYVVQQILLQAPFRPFLSGAIFIGLMVYLAIVGRSVKRKREKTLRELEELYAQLEETPPGIQN